LHGGEAELCPRYKGAAFGAKADGAVRPQPESGAAAAEDVIDTAVCKKLDDSGFIDAIERNQ